MPTFTVFTVNGHAVDRLIDILAMRRMERSREARRWVREPGLDTLRLHDPRETGRDPEETFGVALAPEEAANVRDAVADAVMEVVDLIAARERRRERGEGPGLLDTDYCGYEREVEMLASGIGVEWPEGPRPKPLPPERRRSVEEILRSFSAAGTAADRKRPAGKGKGRGRGRA